MGIISGTAGCEWLEDDRHINRALAPPDAVGVWLPSEGALSGLREFKKFKLTDPAHHRIELLPDGKCHYRSHWQYSYVDRQDPESDSYYNTHNCKWTLGTVPGRVKGRMRDAPALLFRLKEGSKGIDTFFFVHERRDQLILWRNIGEPDRKQYMEFRKVPERKP